MSDEAEPDTIAFLCRSLSPSLLASRKTSASSLIMLVSQEVWVEMMGQSYNSKTASHLPARSKTFCRLASTLSPSIPMSETPIENKGFPAMRAKLSAVNVFPTPGWPSRCKSRLKECIQ